MELEADRDAAAATLQAPWRLRVRSAGAGQGPGVPQVVPGGGADPWAVGDGRRAGHLRGAGLERHPVVRGRRRPGRHRALLLRLAAGHAAAAHGVGGVEAVGGLLQPGLAVRRVGHALVPHCREGENFANFTGDQGYPGGKFFDPLGLAGTVKDGVYVPDVEKLERLKLAEIKHARIAMLAMLVFYFEAGQGKTPLGALGL
jgi:hypothetical protein